MADDPKSENGGGDKLPAEHHEVAEAIETLRENYERTQQTRADHDAKTLFWARIAGIGVSIYTALDSHYCWSEHLFGAASQDQCRRRTFVRRYSARY